jgi:tetratricopeptide (TPR) repeat protein
MERLCARLEWKRSDLLMHLADCLTLTGRFGEAEARYLQAYARGGDKALHGYAELADRRGLAAEALRRWHLILAKSEDDPDALDGLARHHLDHADAASARDVYQHLRRVHPECASGWFGLAASHEAHKQWERALKCWQNAREQFPDEVEPLLGAARCYEYTNQSDQAAASFDLAMQLFPDHSTCFIGAARLASRMHEYATARNLWAQTFKRFGDAADVQIEYATFLSKHDDPLSPEIDNALGRLLKSDPTHEAASLLFHECAFAAGNGSISETCLLPDEFPTPLHHFTALLLKARMRALQGDSLGASVLLRDLPGASPDLRHRSLMFLSEMSAIDGDVPEAFACFQEAQNHIQANSQTDKVDSLDTRLESLLGEYRRHSHYFLIGKADLETPELAALLETDLSSLPLALTLARRLDREGWFDGMGLKPVEVNGLKTTAIPRQIYQFLPEVVNTDRVRKAMVTWQEIYTSCGYHCYDLAQATAFFEEHYPLSIVDAFRESNTQTDFFRYALLKEKGGMFIGPDEVCLNAIHWEAGIELVLRFSDDQLSPIFMPGFAAVAPGHEVYANIVDEMFEAAASSSHSWLAPGPGLYTRHVTRWLVKNELLAGPGALADRICIIPQSVYRRFAYSSDFAYKT